MKSNKVFYIEKMAFNLPEDFKGDRKDAIRLMLEYHLSDKAKDNFTVSEPIDVKGYEPFTDLFNDDTIKLAGLTSLLEYDKDKEKWEDKIEIK